MQGRAFFYIHSYHSFQEKQTVYGKVDELGY
ncbi:Uncharacterised protein [Leminorella richardii]|uniref:Uncharacterized protein n=1 Tax=Leminorella richardii TaxID=158841 RepID=A0A2X4USM3_9GAMM|nr:Uncharacterised protein [Leminorella richardii]